MRIDPGPPNVFKQLPRVGIPEPAVAPPAADSQRAQSPFMSRLADAVREVNATQQSADVEVAKLATGDADNLHDVVIAMEKADLALQLTVQVTQKAIDAYREISRMQV